MSGQGSFQVVNCKGWPELPSAVTPHRAWLTKVHEIQHHHDEVQVGRLCDCEHLRTGSFFKVEVGEAGQGSDCDQAFSGSRYSLRDIFVCTVFRVWCTPGVLL
jgi:hypothetical protein